MVRWLHACRRKMTRKALEGVLSLNRWLGVRGALRLGEGVGHLSSWSPFIRHRLANNWRQVGISPTEDKLDHYFSMLGTWVGISMSIYQQSLAEVGGESIAEFDDSVGYLDEAYRRGKGVVLAAPHIFGHDVAAGAINCRYPVHAIVRESKDPTHSEIKQRWYEALGLQTVFRGRHSSLVNDTLTYVRLLRAGNILGITPDLPVSANKGLPVWIFGRTVHFSPGVVMLAQRSKAALVTCLGERLPPAPGSKFPRARLSFTKPIVFSPKKGQREQSMHQGLQDWTHVLETYLLNKPENWMFWLDKRWTKLFHTPVSACA